MRHCHYDAAKVVFDRSAGTTVIVLVLVAFTRAIVVPDTVYMRSPPTFGGQDGCSVAPNSDTAQRIGNSFHGITEVRGWICPAHRYFFSHGILYTWFVSSVIVENP